MLAWRLVDGTLVDVAIDASRARLSEKVTLGVRAEHMVLESSRRANSIALQVAHAENRGEQTIAHARLARAPGLLTVRQTPGSAPLHAGSRINAWLPPQRCHPFDATGKAFLHPVTIESGNQAIVV